MYSLRKYHGYSKKTEITKRQNKIFTWDPQKLTNFYLFLYSTFI